MKALDRYIIEKFQITKDSTYYTCQPKDKVELREILEERLAVDENANLNDIDVSAITDMSNLFDSLDPHNIKIDNWDVSNVEDMDGMFEGCKNFNCNLENWDVSNVEDMYAMFWNCSKFEGEGLEKWNPVKCKYMMRMFNYCNSLKNKPSWYKN